MRRPACPAQTVIWFPFGGGLAHTGKPLAKFLPADWAIVGIEGPGRLRTDGSPILDIQQLAEYYCDHLGNDLLCSAILIGHSIGALVAAMVGQELEYRGASARALIMGAARPTHTIPPHNPLARMNSGQLFDWWRTIATNSLRADEERELFDTHESSIRADLDLYYSARNRHIGCCKTPAMLVLGEADHICPVTLADEWYRAFPELHIEKCAGRHLFVIETPEDYAGRIQRFVEVTKDGAQERGGLKSTSRMRVVESVDGITKLFPQGPPGTPSKRLPDTTSVREALARDGTVLLQGFDIGGATEFADLLGALGIVPISYDLGNSPRSHRGNQIYTASEYSAKLPISPHCELSYTLTPPSIVAFCCVTPAEGGGATIIVSMQAVLDSLPDRLVNRFADQGVLYLQRMSRRPSLGRSWPAALGTDDPDYAELKLLERSLTFEWRKGHDELIIWYRGAGTLHNAKSNAAIWFNQADQWHHSTLPVVAQELGNALPHDCRFGNGDEISAAEVITIRAALDRHSQSLQLKQGDVLLLDNFCVGHGRHPFTGCREMLVGLAQPRLITLESGGGRWS